MNGLKTKHLEIIHGVINRHSQNSFALKGWAVIIVAAILALSAKEADPLFLVVALLPIVAFWGLDAYYLRQERLFRRLYDRVRGLPDSELENNPFSLDTIPFCIPEFPQSMADEAEFVARWLRACLSKTIFWFYGSLALVNIAIICLVLIFG